MKRIAVVVVTMVACAVFAADKCDGHGHKHEQEHAHEPEHEHEHRHGHEHGQGAGVEVSATAAKAMGLRTVRPEKRRMRSTVSLLGRVELAPDARQSASSPVSGRVSLKVRPQQSVKPGEALFTVDSPELKAKAKEIEVLARRLKVYHELKRSSADLEAQLSLRQAELESMLAGAEASDGVVVIRATADGVVDGLPVADGAWIASGTAVVELIRPERKRAKVLVVSSEAARLGDGMKVLGGESAGTLKLGFGDESGLIPVYAYFDAGLAARPGARLRLDCVTDGKEEAVTAVPSDSIVRVGLDPTVFVRDEHDPDRFLALKVVPGRTNGGWTEVKGLPDDDDLEIAVDGAYELKIALAAQAGAAPAGHFHADGTFHEGKDD